MSEFSVTLYSLFSVIASISIQMVFFLLLNGGGLVCAYLLLQISPKKNVSGAARSSERGSHGISVSGKYSFFKNQENNTLMFGVIWCCYG